MQDAKVLNIIAAMIVIQEIHIKIMCNHGFFYSNQLCGNFAQT